MAQSKTYLAGSWHEKENVCNLAHVLLIVTVPKCPNFAMNNLSLAL